MTAVVQHSETILAVSELFFENLVNHEVYSFGIIVWRTQQKRGWYITQDDELLKVTLISKLTIADDVAKTDEPPQYQWSMTGDLDESSHIRHPQICLTIHASDARVSFIIVRQYEFDLNDPDSLYDLLNVVRP